MVATVNIMVVGRTYEISCDEGQEEDVRALAAEVDRRATELLRAVGQVGDARLLVMVGLMMADEIAELRRRDGGGTPAPMLAATQDEDDAALSTKLDVLARQINAIADRLEKA
ncbi:cell division protein ZapA [Telmatospirillum siberiense]|uniref:Cell division protein ZapA n=1 Tax=Telmatospirillum siberiense TaxID=382514 RepID=A0A2N3PXE2_9PROT|nr:cell division protein ZapA [Telmatospirillum siberiense]PKU25076.1 cell division protein ZapA [Telmatospirillum siberiense]